MPGSRVSKEEVIRFLEQNGCKLLSNNYINTSTDIEYRCVCGHNRVSKFKKIKHYKQFTCLECMGYISKEMVVDFLAQHNCELLSEYKSSNIKIKIKCDCGHLRVSTFKYIKSAKQFSCIKCTKLKARRFGEKRRCMFDQKRCMLLEKALNKSIKQREQFLPENYDKTIQCLRCNNEKSIRLFTSGKICKSCIKLKESIKRDKYSKEQHIHEMVHKCTVTSKLRYGRGRKIFQDKTNLIDEAFILKLCDKQGDKCFYSGVSFVWKHGVNEKPSIDRIDPNLPYSKDNVQMVIKIVNQAKNDLSHDEFLYMVDSIQNPLKETPHTLPALSWVPITHLLCGCRSRAKARLVSRTKHPNSGVFALTRDIINKIYKRQKGRCVYTGVVLYTKDYDVDKFHKLSIDRIDSDGGYTENNVQLVSYPTNQAKSDLTHNEFLNLIEKIHTNMKL